MRSQVKLSIDEMRMPVYTARSAASFRCFGKCFRSSPYSSGVSHQLRQCADALTDLRYRCGAKVESNAVRILALGRENRTGRDTDARGLRQPIQCQGVDGLG